ncbi:MAG: hypothetical protein IIC67_06610, partial [Thaumarchaeota archaeon]|nr:hypothetical protein [Nitrososphaerota archaeon]
KDYLGDNFIILNGDDIFKPKVIRNLVNENKKKTACMVISEKDRYDQDDMKVVINDNEIKKVGKDVSLSSANGESIGMVRFIDNGAKKFKDKLIRSAFDKENLSKFWLTAVQGFIDEGNTLHLSKCKPEDWAEIDFHFDLENIKMKWKKYTKDLKNW